MVYWDQSYHVTHGDAQNPAHAGLPTCLQIARRRLAELAALPADAYAAAKRALRGAVPSDLATDEAEASWLREAVPVWTGGDVKARVQTVLRGPGK